MSKKTPKNLQVPKTVKNADFNNFIEKKLQQVIDIIQRTYLSLSFCKNFDLFSKSSIGQCSDHLQTVYITALNIKQGIPISEKDMDDTLATIQSIFDKLSIVFSTYGTYSINDVYYVVFGTKYNKFDNYDENNKFIRDKLELLEKYTMPIGYKNLPWSDCNNDNEEIEKITDITLQIDKYAHIECFEPTTMYSSIHQSVFGLRILVRNSNDNKLLCISAIAKDIPLQYLLDNEYILIRMETIKEHLKSNNTNNIELIERWCETITLKDILIYSSNDFQKKFNIMLKDVEYVTNNRVDNIVKKFFDMDLISRRKMLINLFTYNKDNEVQYIAYMLYDLIGSVENTEGSDNNEQILLYESLPWKLKQYFKETMINTIEYTQDSLSNCDLSKISLEQQVLLMKADDKIKDRAKLKLKEIKQKSDDQGNKSKQYLEGLVRVPFGIYRKEPILCKMDCLNELFKDLKNIINTDINSKDKYTLHEIKNNINTVNSELLLKSIENCKKQLQKSTKQDLVKSLKIFVDSLSNDHKTKAGIIKTLTTYLTNAKTDSELSKEIYEMLHIISPGDLNNNINKQIVKINKEITDVEDSMIQINDYLDDSIYGHEKAKQQILKIIGQWINGEQKGYCFGFEGSPGVGKTSLAKRGLARCLEDENKVTRPFSFIALGGSSNGSTLEGHNYTYVNSTWGKIVDVLMESKCMNPIIYIDELDKVSKTEQGREIIGILTHLIDTTQNDEFQDRYFSGVPFDLSKALFIFSYNDPEQIDRILLDRIHRIRFDNLSWSDKIVIVNKFIMPELNQKMGFENTVNLTDDVIKFIIETYTMEPGVRKLKEVLFDLYGEINLQLLNFSNDNNGDVIELPVEISVEDFGKKYLKKQRKVSDIKIHSEPMTGTINGMWANALGKGGIIPIETRFYPAGSFLELKLTGMQGDVMKESMTVAKTLAWSLTSEDKQKELTKHFEETKNQGLHVHCPEGAVSKDGPSAGGAITLSIYSLLNNIPINNTISMTGETNLRGRITAIGGLDTKILGSMRAGVKKVLYPKENQEDFDDFLEKYKNVINMDEMSFHAVDTIQEAMKLVFD
jgi:ATP-dependent Lon protease